MNTSIESGQNGSSQEVVYSSLLKEALGGRYPRAPFLGAKRERPYVARKGRQDVALEDEPLLVSLVQETDRALATLPAEVQDRYFTRLFDTDAVHRVIDESAKIARDILFEDKQACVVAPVAGALPLARYLHALGVPDTRIYPVEITGTVGAKAGKARIIGKLPQAVKDPQRRVILFDDVIDVGTTVAVLLDARERERAGQAGISVVRESQTDFLNELKAAKSEHTNGAIYHLFSRICEEQNVIVVPVFIKNPDIIHALAHRCKELKQGNVAWKNLQQIVIDHYDFKEHLVGDVWVLGGGLLDVAIELDNVIKGLPEHLRKDTRVLNWAGNESDCWLLCIGRQIPGLVYLDSDKEVQTEQLKKITMLVAQILQKHLEEFTSTEPRNLPASPVQI